MTASTLQEILAEAFENGARWRDDVAKDYPDDERNKRSARGLRDLAVYVRELPDDDPRLRILEDSRFGDLEVHFNIVMDDESPYPSYLRQNPAMFRFHDPDETVSATFGIFVKRWQAARVVSLIGDDPNQLVKRAADGMFVGVDGLLAVDALRTWVNDFEAGCVRQARADGATWDYIAQNLGQSTQAVWKRYQKESDSAAAS